MVRHITGRVIDALSRLTAPLFSGTPPRRHSSRKGSERGNTLPELEHPMKRRLKPGYGCNKRAANAVKAGGSDDNTGDNYPLSKEKSPVGVESTLENLKKRTKSTVRNLNRVNLYHFIGETVVKSGGIEGGQKRSVKSEG